MARTKSEVVGLTIITALALLLDIPTILPANIDNLLEAGVFLLLLVLFSSLLTQKRYLLSTVTGVLLLIYNPVSLIISNFEVPYLVDMAAAIGLFIVSLLGEKD